MLHGRVEQEHQLWHHHQVWHQPGACGLQEGIGVARDRFAGFQPELQQRLLAAKNPHRTFISKEVLLEETAIGHSMGLEVETDMLDEMGRITLGMQSRGKLSAATQRWLWRLSSRQCRGFWEANRELEQLCINSRRQLSSHAVAVPLGPGMSATGSQTDSNLVRLSLQVTGETLKLATVDPSNTKPSAMELVQIDSGADELEFNLGEPEKAALSPAGLLRIGTQLTLSKANFQHIWLASDKQTCQLRQIEKPAWAASIEQGPAGLYCTLSDSRRLRWCYPGEQLPRESHPLSANPETEQVAWVCEQQWSAFMDRTPGWAIEGSDMTSGLDQYGRYLDLQLANQTLRLRWIPPGEFWMGSAEDEPDRYDDERRHRVVLSHGFWMAETACSQGLWRAVIGDNPSGFKGDDLPVEQVNWEEVQAFCTHLNERFPGLQARLPTEAEWEFACRANTETPFWWGSRLTTELANYDGNYPYNNGPKGEYRNETLPVRHFAPNPWGLYQMHGNVYEWCADWYDAYSDEKKKTDPLGPVRGSILVGRGGSWVFSGRGLRAALRSFQTPDFRNRDLGFRLAAGPRPGGAKEFEADEEAAAEGSGRQVNAPV